MFSRAVEIFLAVALSWQQVFQFVFLVTTNGCLISMIANE